jgi:di/tricarboxylate transporter
MSNALRNHGLAPFRLFDFTPVGLAVMVAGIGFIALAGRHLLPKRDPLLEYRSREQMEQEEEERLRSQLFTVHLPEDSLMGGKSLAESRLGAGLDLNVIAILRKGESLLAPDAHAVLHPGDRLVVEGRADQLESFKNSQILAPEPDALVMDKIAPAEIEFGEATLAEDSPWAGQTLRQLNFRHRFGLNVVAMWREGRPRRTNLADVPLQKSDILLVQGPRMRVESLSKETGIFAAPSERAQVYHLEERLMFLRVPPDSTLVGKTLPESRLGDAFGLTVLGIFREGHAYFVPDESEKLMENDRLLIEGKREDLLTLHSLQEIEIERFPPSPIPRLETDEIGFVEVVLSPHGSLAGKSLRELRFREKFGLSVVAIHREGRMLLSNLRDVALRFGDGLLLYGLRKRGEMLGAEPDFVVLTAQAQERPRLAKMPLAVLVMGLFVLPVILGWLPVHMGAIAGATLMVLSGCLTMEEAYRAINWRSVFLIAGMLPLGIAMEKTGTAKFLAGEVFEMIGGLGPHAVIGGVFVLTALAAQVMPTSAVAILVAPMVLKTAQDLGMSPHALMMTAAISASASFLSPVAHPANVLVMGPGGYRFTDYTKVGIPLTLISLAVVLLMVPVFWPVNP